MLKIGEEWSRVRAMNICWGFKSLAMYDPVEALREGFSDHCRTGADVLGEALLPLVGDVM